jgi:hypothetical protein
MVALANAIGKNTPVQILNSPIPLKSYILFKVKIVFVSTNQSPASEVRA